MDDPVASLLRSALEIVESKKNNGDSPAKAFIDLVLPGVSIRTGSDRRTGGYHYYLVMPRGWKPDTDDRRFVHNTERGYYWCSALAETKHEALKLGLIRLLEVS
jgi:hypothetical protein